jgi:hypothetical protein
MFKNYYPIKLYIKNLPNLIMLGSSLILNIAVWFWLFWQIRPQEEQIFLHYNILFGVDLVGSWWRIVFVPLSGLLIIIVNAILGWVLFRKDKFASQLLNATSVVCQIFLLIVASLLVFLNV